ncbi:hypothetical protein [Gallaecimonas pentaromativorans]|nr:hypothetical protein [Gallaecimonas pentaromativorans]
MKDYLPYLTLVIAIYGAVLSTITLLRGRRRLRPKFEMGFLCFPDKTITTFGLLEITNCSSVAVYIKEYGFEVEGNVMQVKKIPNEVHSSLTEAGFDSKKLSAVDLHKSKETFLDEVQLIQGGQSASQYFYARDIKRVFLEQQKAKIFGYCVDQTDKKYRCKISKELILSSQEPV